MNSNIEARTVQIEPIVPAGDLTNQDLEDAKQVLTMLNRFVKSVLKKSIDYGTIPGCGDKLVLLKPGAEKLCRLFKLRPTFSLEDKIVDFKDGIFYYHYKCILYRNGELVGEGEGLAHSGESKYTTTSIACPKCGAEGTIMKDKTKGSYYCWAKKGGCGATNLQVDMSKSTTKFQPNQLNTLLKMAQKRALLAAVLVVTGASDFFTQDLEDFQ